MSQAKYVMKVPKLEWMVILERNRFTSSFYYSKQTTFCQSLPYQLLSIITQAEKLPEGVKTKAKICHHFKKLWIYSAPCPESAKSISVERRASHRFPSEWGNRERETLLPPLALGEDSNLRLAALSHVATWMEIFCTPSRTALTGRFIMWGSAARGLPQTPAAAWTSSGSPEVWSAALQRHPGLWGVCVCGGDLLTIHLSSVVHK